MAHICDRHYIAVVWCWLEEHSIGSLVRPKGTPHPTTENTFTLSLLRTGLCEDNQISPSDTLFCIFTLTSLGQCGYVFIKSVLTTNFATPGQSSYGLKRFCLRMWRSNKSDITHYVFYQSDSQS